jgi:hypothetical protein
MPNNTQVGQQENGEFVVRKLQPHKSAVDTMEFFKAGDAEIVWVEEEDDEQIVKATMEVENGK